MILEIANLRGLRVLSIEFVETVSRLITNLFIGVASIVRSLLGLVAHVIIFPLELIAEATLNVADWCEQISQRWANEEE